MEPERKQALCYYCKTCPRTKELSMVLKWGYPLCFQFWFVTACYCHLSFLRNGGKDYVFMFGILKELTSVAIITLHWSIYKAHRIIMRTVSSGENLRLLGAAYMAEIFFFAGSIAALLAAGGVTSSPAHRSITRTDNHQSTLTPADNLELPIKLMRAIKREAKVPVETPQQPQETNPSKPLHQKCTFSKLLCTLLTAKSESKTLAQPLALMWRMMKSFISRTLPSILFRTSTSLRVIWCI